MCSLLVLALAVSAPVPKAPPPKLDDKKLEGIWVPTEFETRGRVLQEKNGAQNINTLIILDGKYYFRRSAGTIVVDPKNSTFDMQITEGKDAGQPWPALFERTGDTLKVAVPAFPTNRFGQEKKPSRPSELRTGPQTSHVVLTFTLDKKATPADVATQLKERTEKTRAEAAPPELPPTPNEKKTQEMLQQVLDKLDKLEKRVNELEKKMPPPK